MPKLNRKKSKMTKRVRDITRPSVPTTVAPVHEYSRWGLHRIVCGDLVGQWYGYQQIATLKTPTVLLHACTDYHHGSLPTNAVFTVQEVKGS